MCFLWITFLHPGCSCFGVLCSYNKYSYLYSWNILFNISLQQIKERKRPLPKSYRISALTLLIGGSNAVFGQPQIEILLIRRCNIALVLLCAALNMIFIHTPELFPSSIRIQCLGNAVSFERIGSMLCSLVGQLDYPYGHGIPLIINGVVLILRVLLPCLLLDTDRENLADHVEPDNEKEGENKTKTTFGLKTKSFWHYSIP